ncbi:predicted protein [Botrytis cinerea T4]|uniref:Uncharacterized protein n=1 Tax=Botryotinia fuckeliana (strain T4) TaxID=999810 RepID=G2YRV2_BOTF4|nr:predicted protein [Botrytis cinerea T4]
MRMMNVAALASLRIDIARDILHGEASLCKLGRRPPTMVRKFA